MAANRRTLWLAITLVVLLVVAGVVWTGSGGGTVSPAARQRTAASPQAGNAGGDDQPPPRVRLDALAVQRAEPGDAERNPFRFDAGGPPPGTFEPQTPLNQAGVSPVLPPTPTGPPPPPPIPLKFIGVVEQGGKRVAVLSDGRSTPYGTEGAIILGQYRILKIGIESIEMSYVDGRGRQTIRLTGQ